MVNIKFIVCSFNFYSIYDRDAQVVWSTQTLSLFFLIEFVYVSNNNFEENVFRVLILNFHLSSFFFQYMHILFYAVYLKLGFIIVKWIIIGFISFIILNQLVLWYSLNVFLLIFKTLFICYIQNFVLGYQKD